VPRWYEPETTRGILTYRCGDHALAMAQSYLRTGDPTVYDIFRDHPLLFCDWSISHCKPGMGNTSGGCHYYCNFNAYVHVYSRLAGPLWCYLVEGDPWLLETAESMGAFLCKNWHGDDHPSDQQTRSVYPARGLAQLYEVTGNRAYWNEAVDRTIWYLQTGVEPDGAVRGFANRPDRLSPLYAGYCGLGVIPVAERVDNPKLTKSLRATADWLVKTQGTVDGPPIGVGGWVRDTIWRGRKNFNPGNSGSATLCSEILAWTAERTGEQRYFYAAAAGWANLAGAATHHPGIKGGLPLALDRPDNIGTWSDKLPVYLHRVAAVAQRLELPFVVAGVLDPQREMPVVAFVAPGGRFADGELRQPMFFATDEPTRLTVWCPRPPREAQLDGEPLEMAFDAATGLARVTVPGGSSSGVLVIR
jgi:hypothetical protein